LLATRAAAEDPHATAAFAAEEQTMEFPGLLLYASLALGGLSLAAMLFGLLFYRGGAAVVVSESEDERLPTGKKRRGQIAATTTRSAAFAMEMHPYDLVHGLWRGDPAAIRFALAGGGLAGFVLFLFVAVGAWLVRSGKRDGYLWIGFTLLFPACAIWVSVRGYLEKRRALARAAGPGPADQRT
jgi:hypothetical protein